MTARRSPLPTWPSCAAQRSGEAEFTTLTSAKVRPVLVIADAGYSFDGPASLALRLRRCSKLDPDEQRAVREDRAPRLFHLRPDRFAGLPEENAALLTDPVRVARGAIDESEDLGGIDGNELCVLHERVVRYYNFELAVLARRLLDVRLRDQT